MKFAKILLSAMLAAACSTEAAEKAPGAVAPAENPDPLTGSVQSGDTTYLSLPGGKTDSLIQSGNSVIYRQNGISTFIPTENGKTPQFIQNAKGQVVGPLKPAQAPEIVRNPNPASIRPNAPSPVVRTGNPGFSTMPSSPFLRGNPRRR